MASLLQRAAAGGDPHSTARTRSTRTWRTGKDRARDRDARGHLHAPTRQERERGVVFSCLGFYVLRSRKPPYWLLHTPDPGPTL